MSRREHIQQSSIVIPEPYVECPFTNNAADIKGHLAWDNVVNVTFTNGCANFNGSSSYLRSQKHIPFSKIKTVTYLVKFNVVPAVDAPSSTWQALHYFQAYDYYNYAAYYSILQNYSPESVGLTNNARSTSYSAANNTLTNSVGSTQAGVWYRITFRRNPNNTTDLWIDNLTRTVNASIPDNYSPDIIFGKLYPNNIRWLNGAIKDFRIWDIELTDEQIAAL